MTAEIFRPMLAASLPCAKRKEHVPTAEEVIADLKKLNWERGFWVSPKLDGIRGIVSPEGLVSRSLTLIPNKHVQNALSGLTMQMLDGELVLDDWNSNREFNDNQSAFMSREGKPNFTFAVFDDITNADYRFSKRNDDAYARVKEFQEKIGEPFGWKLHHLEQVLVKNLDELLEYEEALIALGWEGVIMRDPGRGYKNNRSTFREQGMIKLKRFIDGEAEIIGFDELQRNNNEATTSALGYTKRSDHLAGMEGGDTLGRLQLRGVNGPWTSVEFWCGSGLNDTLRRQIWEDRPGYLGKIVKYKFQATGSKEKPRTPIFLGFRDGRDM